MMAAFSDNQRGDMLAFGEHALYEFREGTREVNSAAVVKLPSFETKSLPTSRNGRTSNLEFVCSGFVLLSLNTPKLSDETVTVPNEICLLLYSSRTGLLEALGRTCRQTLAAKESRLAIARCRNRHCSALAASSLAANASNKTWCHSRARRDAWRDIQ